MKLTPRGYAAVAVVVLAIVLGWQFGSRSLNAIAAPTLAALAVSAVVVARADPPSVSFDPLDAGFPGESRTLLVSLTGSGLTRLELAFPEGIEQAAIEQTLTLPTTVERTIDLDRRGVYELGPPTVRQRGPLGLVERRIDTSATAELVVFPSLYSLSQNAILSRFFLDELEAEKQKFERLREYNPGDPLRRVHWKSSAKHEEFLVMEFAPSMRSETVTIVASARDDGIDEMARIAATIADVVLDAGFNVELAAPDGHVPPGQGSAHRENILWLLARTDSGRVSADVGDPDVEIRAEGPETTITIAGTEYTRESIFGAEEPPVVEVEDDETDSEPEVTA